MNSEVEPVRLFQVKEIIENDGSIFSNKVYRLVEMYLVNQGFQAYIVAIDGLGTPIESYRFPDSDHLRSVINYYLRSIGEID